ncbi:MAG: protein BatD [Desulfobacteraceae bacterium]|nr:protein BatD [Desulfobacteraceae bacterium]
MKRNFFLFQTLLLLVLLPCPALAQVSVALNLDRGEATTTDTVQMVVTVSGVRNADSEPVIEGLGSFSVSRGGSSSRVQIINGRISANIDYTYYIQAKEVGTFRIGPAKIKIKGKTFPSNTETLTIREAAVSPGKKAPLFLTASLSTAKAYVEEQVLYTLKLYLRVNVSDISLQLPESKHLSIRQLGKAREYQAVHIDRKYRVLEVRHVLIPSRPGHYGIHPSQMRMTVHEPRPRGRRHGLFDDPFFRDPFLGAGRPVTLSSEPLELEVMALPESGRPADFSGLVGNFKMTSQLTPTKIREGESATLTVRISGRGNVNRIPDLRGPELAHVKVYADEPLLNVQPDSRGLKGEKIMKWAIVPEKEGDYKIPPLSLGFFDPEDRQYHVIHTPSHSLMVLPGKGKTLTVEVNKEIQGNEGRTPKQEVKEIGHDILPVHGSVRGLETPLWTQVRGPFPWLALLLPFLAYWGTYLGFRLKKKSARSLPATTAKRAAKKLLKQCHDSGTDARDLTLAVRGYLNDRFGLSLASLTPDDAHEILRSNGVSCDTAQRLRMILEELENAIFTGRAEQSCRSVEDIPKLINQIEKEIR